jgi:hypothetical protein
MVEALRSDIVRLQWIALSDSCLGVRSGLRPDILARWAGFYQVRHAHFRPICSKTRGGKMLDRWKWGNDNATAVDLASTSKSVPVDLLPVIEVNAND